MADNTRRDEDPVDNFATDPRLVALVDAISNAGYLSWHARFYDSDGYEWDVLCARTEKKKKEETTEEDEE